MTSRDSGQVIHWSHDRKYGFVRPDHGERDVFVRLTAFPEGAEPRIGDRITYTVAADRRPGREAKLCAVDVRFVVEENKTAAEGLFMRGGSCGRAAGRP
jgi:cold shock CspA family protein